MQVLFALSLFVGIDGDVDWFQATLPHQAESPKTLRREPKKLGVGANDGPSLGWVVVWSAVVMLLLVGFLYLFRRLMRRGGGALEGGLMKVLGRQRLSAAHTVYLVEIGPKLLLIGTTKDGIQTLGQFSDPQEVALLRAKLGKEGTLATFEDSLKAELAQREKSDPDAQRATAGILDLVNEIKGMVSSWRK